MNEQTDRKNAAISRINAACSDEKAKEYAEKTIYFKIGTWCLKRAIFLGNSKDICIQIRKEFRGEL